MLSATQRLKPEGIPLKIDNTTRLVTGLTKQTTCSDVIKMALNKTGTDNKDNHYMYYIQQSSNGSETSIPDRSRILSLLKHSTDKKINFILRKRKSVSITKSAGSSSSLSEISAKRQCRSKLKFNASTSLIPELDDSSVKVLKVTQHKEEKTTTACQDVADLAKFVQSQMTMLTQQYDTDDKLQDDTICSTSEPEYKANDTFAHDVLIENTSDFFDATTTRNIREHKRLPKITKDKPKRVGRHPHTPVHKKTLDTSTNRSPGFRTSLPFRKLSKLSKACLRTPSYKLEKSAARNTFRFLQRRNSNILNETISQLQHSESQRYYELSNSSLNADSGVLDTTRDATKDVNGNCRKQPNFLDSFLMDKRYKRQAVSEQLNRRFVDYEHVRSNCLDGSFLEQTDAFTGRFDEFTNIQKTRLALVNASTDSVRVDSNTTMGVDESSTEIKRKNTLNKQKDGEDVSDYIKRIFTKPVDVDEDAYMESFMTLC